MLGNAQYHHVKCLLFVRSNTGKQLAVVTSRVLLKVYDGVHKTVAMSQSALLFAKHDDN
jgi:hypothetical protein